MAANLGTAFVRVRGDLSHLNAQIISTLAPTKLNKLAKGAGVAIGAGLVAGGAGKGLFDLGKSFDEAYDNIRTSTGATGDVLKGLQGDFKDVLKDVPTDFASAGDAVATLNQRLGVTGAPLRQLARQILQFSRITKTDAGANVAAVTRLFGDWSVKTEDQAGQMNKLFRLTQKTGIGLDDLARLMVKFGSPLRTLGFDFEEAAAMFGRFEREGVNLQTTLPGFKIALKNFAKPTEELSAKFKKFGVDAETPRKALKQVFELLKTLPRREGTQLAFEVFGSRAASDMFRAVKEGRFEFDDLIASMRDGTETIDKAERNTRDFGEQWQLLKNRIFVGLEPLANKVFDTIGDGMEKLAKADFGSLFDSLTVGKALEGVEAAVGRFGPKIAAALVRGFLSAPSLVQLLGGAWLIKKATPLLASAGLLGRQAGTAFSAGMATTAATGGAASLGAGAAAGPKIRRAAAGEVGALAGGAVALGSGFRSGAPVSQLGPAKGLTRVNAGLSTMLASLRAAPGLWAGLGAAIVIAGVKIKQSKTFEGLVGGKIDEQAAKVQAGGLAAMRSGLDEITAASQRAQAALPGIAAAEENVARLRKQGKTSSHEYAEAIRALDTVEAERIIALRQQGEAQKKVAEGVRESLRASVGRLLLDRKLGVSGKKLSEDAVQVAQAYSRQAAAQANVSRGMRGLAAITGPTGTKMGALLKTLSGIAGFPAFKKLLITADISQASAAVRLVEKLRTLGREKTALKIIAESKSPEEALKRLRGLVGDLARRDHRITMRLKDEATLRVERLKRLIQRLPEGKISVDVVAGKISVADALDRRIADSFQRAGLGQAGKAIRRRALGGTVKEAFTLVGEEGPELAKFGGKTTLIGQEGPEILSLPENTRVYSHPETKRKLAPIIQKVSRVLDGKSLPGVEAAKQSVGRSFSRPSGGRTIARVAEKLGIRGFAKGGTVKASQTPEYRRKFYDIARDAWPKVSKYFPRTGSMPVIHFSKDRAYTYRDSPGLASGVWIPAGDAKAAAERSGLSNALSTYGLGTLVHEWAHIFQGGEAKKNRSRLSEGGAEAFARHVAPRVFPNYGPHITEYAGLVRSVIKDKGLGWVLGDQFKGTRASGRAERRRAKAPDPVEPSPAKAKGRASASFTPAVRYLISTMREKFGLSVSPQGGLRPGDTDSFHSVGKAADFVGPKMREAASWVKDSGLYKTLLEGIHNPNLSTDSGKLVSPGFWGAETWRGHKDHIHLAASRIAETVKEKAKGKTGGPKRITGGRLKLGQMVTLAKQAGFPDPALAAAIGYVESKHGQVRAHNTDGEDSRGLWQINVAPGANPKYKDWNLFDARVNAKAAFQISNGGKNWRPWTVYTSGAYKDFLGGKGKPLPRGTDTGTPKGSSYADYLALKLTEAEGTKSDKRDDIRWINRALRYYRGIYRRNKGSNSVRANEALQEVHSLRDKKKELRTKEEDPDLFTLGELTQIGTGPNAFKIGGLQTTIDNIELEKARASLTIPADTDDSPGGLAASLQDDIGAAGRLVGVWDGLNRLVTGFRMPDRPLTGAFDPTPAQTRQLNRTKSQEERIALLLRFRDEATQGPWIEGTIKQKIEAATNLGSAKDDLRNLNAEISKTTEGEADQGPLLELVRQQLEESRKELAISKAQFPVFERFKKAPRFHEGGVIQGPAGSDQPAILKAKEGVFTPEQMAAMGQPQPQAVLVVVEDGAVDSSKIRAVAWDAMTEREREMIRKARSGPAIGRKYAFNR